MRSHYVLKYHLILLPCLPAFEQSNSLVSEETILVIRDRLPTPGGPTSTKLFLQYYEKSLINKNKKDIKYDKNYILKWHFEYARERKSNE